MSNEMQHLIEEVALTLKQMGAKEVYLFGSAATDTMRENSDLDFAVSGLPPEVYFTAMGEANDVAGRQVDIVDLDEDNPFTRYLKEECQLISV